MANDSNQTQGAQHDDNMGVSAAHDDAGIVQVAEATGTTGANAPAANGGAAPAALPDQTINVVIPQGATVVRVPVAAGDTIDLPPPFNSGAILDPSHGNGAKEGDGNLAIKVGDVTVILQGYIEASNDPTHPVTIEAADHQAVDIATVLASTDPNANIPTAAGPAAGAQGADNGHFFADFATGPGLGGLNAIGVLDATDLSYKLIDNSIRQDLPNTLAGGTPFTFSIGTPVGSMDEHFLKDPAHTLTETTYQQFAADYKADNYNWGDFAGSTSNDPDFLAHLSQSVQITVSSTPATVLLTDVSNLSSLTSAGQNLHEVFADNNQTAFITRDDGTLVAVVHIDHQPGSDVFTITTQMINRFDDVDANGNPTDSDSLVVDFNVYQGDVSVSTGTNSDEPTQLPPGGLPGESTFTLVDDTPTAASDSDGVAGAIGDTTMGNVITGDHDAKDTDSHLSQDTSGADGVSVTSVTGSGGNGVPVSSLAALPSASFTAHGTYGDLVMHADGTYTYTVTKEGLNDNTQDVFNYTITDNDGDTSTATLTITSHSVPEITQETPAGSPGAVIVDEANLSIGSHPDAAALTTGGTFLVDSHGEGFTSVTVGGKDIPLTGGGFPITVDTDHGTMTITGVTAKGGESYDIAYSYTLTDTVINGNPDQLLATVPIHVVDKSGDAADSHLTIDVKDDVPTANADSDTVAHAIASTTTGNVVTGAGDADSHLAVDTKGADGATVTNATGAGGASTVAGGVITAHGLYGDLVIHADGSYTYTVTKDGLNDKQGDTFNYTLTDGDGDTSATTLTIGSTAVPTITQETPAGTPGEVIVNEANLATGSHPDAAALTTGGTFLVDSHGEGFTSVTVGGKDIPLTGGGFPITVDTDHGTMTITGVTAKGGESYDIAYSYTLTDTVINGNPDQLLATVPIHVVDKSGDAADSHLTIDVKDDVPTANADSDTVAHAIASTTTGNVVTGAGDADSHLAVDTKGADGATVTNATGAGGASTVAGGVITAHGLYGDLVIHADGSYTYTVTKDGLNDKQGDSFNYTLTDGDGDTSATTLTIGSTAVPTITQETPAGTPGEVIVNEANLATGSHPDAAALTTGGTFLVDSHGEGFTSVTVGGKDIPLTGGGFPITVDTDHGTMTITGVTAKGGESYDIAYSYTLTDTVINGNPDQLLATVPIHVVDKSGDAADSHLTIDVKDDVPTANADSDTVAHAIASTTTGNVVTGAGDADSHLAVDTKGADGATVTNATGAGGASTVAGGVITAHGLYGDLVIHADGSYTYTVTKDGLNDKQGDTFNYTLTDGDGDTSATTLTIGSTAVPTITQETPAGTPGEVIVNEANLATGSHPDAAALTTGGTFLVDSHGEGFTSVTVGGKDIPLTGGGFPITVDTDHGTMTITGVTAKGGESYDIAYSYTLTDTVINGNPDQLLATVPIHVVDKSGDAADSHLTIDVKDDVPTAANDSFNIHNTSGSGLVLAASGVEHNDVFGADGKSGGGVVGVAKGDTGANLDGTGVATVIHGDHGNLTLNADGSYTYTRTDTGPLTADDKFTYTIKDSDGDLSHAVLDVTIDDSGVTVIPPPPPGPNDDPATLTTSPTTVFESALGTDATHANAGGFLGTNPTSTDETTTGHVTVTAKDGVGSIDIDGTTVNLANASSTGTIHGDHGDLSITGWNATTGQLDYSYTLTKADTTHTAGNDIDVNGEDFKITVKDSDGDMGTGDLKIGIVDDVPTAANGTKELAPSGGQFNVLLILDTSGSMREDSGVLNTATGKDYTKLQLEGQAVKDLLNGYPADTMVQIATFSTDGHQTSPTWMTVAQAEAKVDALVGTGKDPFSDGQTNYQAALTNGETAFNTPGAITGATNVAYFLSDGQPNEPGPLTAGQTSQWTTFLANHDVNAYALGLGPDTDSTTLNPVAYNGHTGANTDAIIVDDLNDLASQIEHTLPTSSSGNLVGDLGGHYGADAAGHVDVGLVTLGGAGQTVVTDAAAHTATVTMTQGVLVIHTDTGDYTYTPAAGQHQSEVDVQFQLEDSEGDKSTTATLKLIPAADTAPTITSNNGNDLALSVAENTTTVTTVQAHDPDAGDKLTYSITGGADQALFTINATTGAVVFKSAPDFEHPTDNGANNIYNITVAATDLDGKSDTQNIAITVTNVANEAAPVAVADHIFTNVTGDVVVQDAWLLSNDTDADSVHSALKITDPVAASAGQSGFFDDQPDHHSGSSTVTFDLDTGTKSGQLNNGDSTGLDYTLQDQSLTGNSGHVTVTYETGATINGSTGDDILIGNNAALHGGHGNDTLVGTGSNDLLDYSDVSTDWSVTLSSTGSGTSNIDGNDTFQGIDGVVGGSGFNTVVLGDGSSYSHTALHDNFRSVEVLDLGKNGTSDNVTLATGSAGLRPEDVISMTDSNHALYITGDSKDIVNVKTGGSGADFALAGTVTNNNAGDHIPDGTYTHYTATVSGTHVDLYVENTVHTQTTNG